jgi:glycine hydroxymethyltransferase
LAEIKIASEKKKFIYTPEKTKIKKTPLYSEHRKLTGKTISFADWQMPIWYKSIGEEHSAVRKSCGLFDIGHMGIMGIKGPHAAIFLDLVSTNYVKGLKDGECQYSFLLDPDGEVVDDIIIYRENVHEFMLVINAINFEKDILWLEAVNSKKCLIDVSYPNKEFSGEKVVIRDLRKTSSKRKQRTGLALQGPDSLTILTSLIPDKRIAILKRMEFLQTQLGDVKLILSRSGYTGESSGYELYLSPDEIAKVWKLLTDKGAIPCGLGARDSLRIEAGLPLYGHELGGEHHLSPQEAGFAPYVKFHKPYFIGREKCLRQTSHPKREIVRFSVKQKGVRAVRGNYLVTDKENNNLGWVTSSALVGGKQMGMACIEKSHSIKGKDMKILVPGIRTSSESTSIEAVILDRFRKTFDNGRLM